MISNNKSNNKVEKIHKNYEFRIVYSRGKCFSNDLLILYIYKNMKNNNSRLGISVSKKVGKSVIRNRVRRLIYENYRINVENLKNGYDFIFIARNKSRFKKFEDIEKSVNNLLKKSGSIV